ncbi:MAG: hypothetical protein ABL886_03175 [Rhodoglobus sp.]
MVQLTGRDEAVLEWLSVVRLADMDAMRFALAGFATNEHPVDPITLRNAQRWVSRMIKVGSIARARPSFQSASIVWATHQAVRRIAPNLYRQTTRHEVAVANLAARYVAQGYHWGRDRRPDSLAEHMADGVATRGSHRELVEVELTPKTLGRYKLIHNSHADRLTGEGFSRVVYACTPNAARVVSREADQYLFRDLRTRLITGAVFDARGTWTGHQDALWVGVPEPEPVMVQAPLFERGLR